MIEARAARLGARLRRHELDGCRRARRRRGAGGARRGRAPQLRPRDARGTKPHRGRPPRGAAPLPGRALGGAARAGGRDRPPRRGRRRDGRCHAPVRARRTRALDGARALRRRAGRVRRSRRSTARRTSTRPERLRAIAEGLRRIDGPLVFPAHPRTRAALDARRAGAAELVATARLPRAARARRRRPESSSPTRAACRRRPTGYGSPASRCGRAPSGSTPWRPARTCSSTTTRTRSRHAVANAAFPASAPPLYGDGHAAERDRSRPVRLTAVPEAERSPVYDVAVIGAGYVGVPLAATFAEAGSRVAARRRASRRSSTRSTRGESHIEDVPSGALAPLVDDGPHRRDHGLRAGRSTRTRSLIALPTPLSRQREPDLSPDRERRAQPRAGAAARARSSCSSRRRGPARRARSCSRSSRRARASRPASTSTSRCRPSASTRAARTGRRRRRRRSSAASLPRRTKAAADVYRARDRHRARGLDARGGRADEAAREHLPRGQHRARQRARAAVRPDGHRRLGGDRRGRDEAVRLRVVQARPRPRRPLHPDRPVLPHLEGARVRLLDALHRAGRRGQQQHAVLLPLADLAGAEPRRAEVAERLEDPDRRRRLQARHRRLARVARREADPPARDRRRRRLLPRPVRARVRRACVGRRSSPRPTTASRS